MVETSKSNTRVALETERLLLRPLKREDLDFVHSVLADPVAMEHYPKCLSREECGEWIERHLVRYREDGCGLWLATLKDGTPVGMIGLVLQVYEL